MDDMKLFDFQLLPDDEKIDILYRKGVYIGKRKEGTLSVLLYQLDSFYVEVFYRKHRSYVLRLKCFSSMSLLDPYLSQINVEQIIYS